MGYYRSEKINLEKDKYTILDESKLGKEYSFLGSGSEGTVYKIDDNTAFKMFNLLREEDKLKNKFSKIELLREIKDSSFAFPTEIVGFSDGYKEGYLMPYIKPSEDYGSLSELNYLKEYSKLLKTVISLSDALKRIHKQGITIGDFRLENIIINHNDNPVFVDTDNYAFLDFDYDIKVYQIDDVEEKYPSLNYQEIDKYLFGKFCLELFCDELYTHINDRMLPLMINMMNINKYEKDALRLLFSRYGNKPYIGDILKSINPKDALISEEQGKILERIR